MIFSNANLLDGDDAINDNDLFYLIESEKERNLYYKFFAGFFFNEFIEGYDSRMTKFLDLLYRKVNIEENLYNFNENSKEKFLELVMDFKSQLLNIHVSFDYHAYQWKEKDDTGFDRGEMSDFVLFCNKGFISTEVKFLENWDFCNDIFKVQRRMGKISKKYREFIKPDFCPAQLLLITKQKYEELIKKEITNENSNLRKLKAIDYNKFYPKNKDIFKECDNNKKEQYLEIPYPVLIILWEEVRDLLLEPSNLHVYNYLNKQLDRKKAKKR